MALGWRAVQMRHADNPLRRAIAVARQNGAGDQVVAGATAQQRIDIPIHNQG